MGQSKAGMSSLWIAFECVVDRTPRVRPWNAPWKDRMDSFGAPGGWFTMHELFSSSVKLTFSPRCFRLYAMNMFLNAFSLAHDPHIIVATFGRPGDI